MNIPCPAFSVFHDRIDRVWGACLNKEGNKKGYTDEQTLDIAAIYKPINPIEFQHDVSICIMSIRFQLMLKQLLTMQLCVYVFIQF